MNNEKSVYCRYWYLHDCNYNLYACVNYVGFDYKWFIFNNHQEDWCSIIRENIKHLELSSIGLNPIDDFTFFDLGLLSNKIEDIVIMDKLKERFESEIMNKTDYRNALLNNDNTTQDKIIEECDKIKNLLLEKNRKYGDSALNPVRVFSQQESVEQLYVRIDDKLSRIANRQNDEDEDVIFDLIGYLILLQIAKNSVEKNK